jgi:hypothetical protein
MKQLIPFLSLCLLAPLATPGEDLRFESHFLDRTMRVDLMQVGDAEEFFFSVDQILEEGAWAGNPHQTIDESAQGMYFARVLDLDTEELLYSRGFATLFGEYRTTTDAKNGIKRAFHCAVRFPFPRRPVTLVIDGRGEGNRLEPIFTAEIDPENVNIIREKPHRDVTVKEIAVHGTPHDQVDIVFVAEGYTAKERRKFWKDAEHYARVILQTEPFARRASDVSIRAVHFPSAESGVDQPRKGIFRNTAIDAAFNALDLDRYLLIDDTRAMRDIAGAAPYDTLIVLANSDRYGGGGIYGDYCISTVDNRRSEFVVMHEFGHGFGNLADEYYGAEVAYNEFFPPGQEPHEPNITALLDPENVKWKHLLTPGIPVPTPWGQEEIAELRARSEALGADTSAARDRLAEEMELILQRYRELYRGKIGVFEGAGYSAKGLYRSEIHIDMFHEGSYGPVSEEAIVRVIDRLTAGGS